MSDIRQIEQELREYLEREPNMRGEDRIVYLMNIMIKHFENDKLDHVVTHREFMGMISDAKSRYATKVFPIRISNREVDSSEVSHVLMIESVIGYLNKNNLLRRLVKFNFTR
jgi:hypothetical protein